MYASGCISFPVLKSIFVLQVSRNNAKSTISELEFQIEQLRQEKTALQGEVNTLQENIAELQIQVFTRYKSYLTDRPPRQYDLDR